MGTGRIGQNRHPCLSQTICGPLDNVARHLTQRIGLTDRHFASQSQRLRPARDFLDFENAEQVSIVGMDINPDTMALRDIENHVEMRNQESEAFARSLLRFAGVAGDLDRPAESLPHGEKRLVEIARSLALRPRVLLFDEPAAGLSKGDKQRLTTLLRRIDDLGVAVIIVEHDMPMIMSLSDHIVVLDGGKRIAIGEPADIRNDPLVRKAYLGDATAKEKQHRPPRQAASETMLEIRKLDAYYGLSQALENIDVTVANGEAIAVLGANGAGKITLMRSIAGLEPMARFVSLTNVSTTSPRMPVLASVLFSCRKDGRYFRN